MRKVAIAVVSVVLLSVVGTATAAATRLYYLNTGDTAILNGSDEQCQVVKVSSGPAFRCFAGGDYRGKYGVLFSNQRVSVIQYTRFKNFNKFPYKVVFTRRQSSILPG